MSLLHSNTKQTQLSFTNHLKFENETTILIHQLVIVSNKNNMLWSNVKQVTVLLIVKLLSTILQNSLCVGLKTKHGEN